EPLVQVQVMAERFSARSRTATAAEKPALWKTMAAIWPPYEEYQQRTTREIPGVILERTWSGPSALLDGRRRRGAHAPDLNDRLLVLRAVVVNLAGVVDDV